MVAAPPLALLPAHASTRGWAHRRQAAQLAAPFADDDRRRGGYALCSRGVVAFLCPRGVFLLPTPRLADARRIERDGAAVAAALFAVEHEAFR